MTTIIKEEIYMKTLMFISLGIVGIVLMMVGNKKNIFMVKGLGIVIVLIFVIMLISIFL